ncbi:hypothetical protein M9H77_11985 [Catharanthus roseus]|uniref:Uncharacterized protein n=1 Tax=Catharanthus roseus TaxID=4058 RepID=A0ACC0BG75_CATRO|nr:hypothetical protein M9H77_11985 [Catharanthus roseus]
MDVKGSLRIISRLDKTYVYIATNRTLIDVPVQDNAFQENVDIVEGSTIDAMIKDVGMLVHDSRSSEELDIDDSDEDFDGDTDNDLNEDADNDPNDDSINENDEDSDT